MRAALSRSAIPAFRIAVCAGLALAIASPVRAGVFQFADRDGDDPNAITHPTGYTGASGVLMIDVCIETGSPNATVMAQSVQNAVNTYNALQPTLGNLVSGGANDLDPSEIDFESVVLHEIGHCIGMAHPNLASESGFGPPDDDYTKAQTGTNAVFNVDDGFDNVIGTSDDLRSDDVPVHWARRSNNNPFTKALVVDGTTYSRLPADFPGSFAANGDRDVGAFLGALSTEAVMNQGSVFDEAQRTLGHDDVATLELAQSGLDRTVGGGDDYTFQLNFIGEAATCDIVARFDNSVGFAQCDIMATKITTETAGSVWKLHVAKGDRVEAGQELMIMEVMKMEVPYEAPVSGTVTAVHVAEGEVVEEDDVAIEIG